MTVGDALAGTQERFNPGFLAMSDGTLLLILLVPAALAFAFGIWVGLGYPGMYDKYEQTGKASRESPFRWLLRGGRKPLTSESRAAAKEQAKKEEEEEDPRARTRPSFDRGRRIRR